MGNTNFSNFCNDIITDNSNQANLGTYINYPNNFCICCPKNSNNEAHQEDLSNQNNIVNKETRKKKFIDINNKNNNLIENEENNKNYDNLHYLEDKYNNNNNNQINGYNNQINDYNNQINDYNKNKINDYNKNKINDYNNRENLQNSNNNRENLQNSNNNFNNNENYDNNNNQENISSQNDSNNNNIEEHNNNINNDNRIDINESILSFRDKIFPKIPEINGPFTYIIPPGTKGPFVRNVSENIEFINEGQLVKVEMDIIIINLPSNQSSISYAISFESQIYDVHCNLQNNYEYDSHHIKFYYNLKNNESIHISFDYKKYNQNICEYYRSEFILISNIFPGAVGEYKVTIPPQYILICQENDLFYQENKNTYIWKGVIPKEGLKEWFKISYRKAKWEAEMHQYIESKNLNDNIKMVELTIPKYYKGGNLNLEEYEIKCSLGSGIDNKYIFEEDNTYRIKMENVASNKVFFQIIATFKNNVLSNWEISNEDEKEITPINNELKNKFKPVVNHILENNKSNYPNFYKIGKFLHEYITYDKSYSGKDMNPDEIFNERRGVCEHFTILYNTLLGVIDIPTIYVCGLANNGEGGKTQIRDIENERHAWTLAKINGRWIPLDATWGILKGIMPVSHVFQHYFKVKIKTKFIGQVKVKELEEVINYLRE